MFAIGVGSTYGGSVHMQRILEDYTRSITFAIPFRLYTIAASWPFFATLDTALAAC